MRGRLLKWAGGKRQLLPELRSFTPPDSTAYREPFLGSGAVFFDLHARGVLDGRAVMLSDTNPDLIACYRAVRDRPEQVIDELSRLASGHAATGRGTTTKCATSDSIRNAQSSPPPGIGVRYTAALAAMFMYLNRTGYNGLFRLNSDGEFNVPAGSYAKPRICDEPNVRRVAKALARFGLTLAVRPLRAHGRASGAGDFLYFDPPYAPLSKTARFTSYTAEGFGATTRSVCGISSSRSRAVAARC